VVGVGEAGDPFGGGGERGAVPGLAGPDPEGPEHPYTLATRLQLAFCTGQARDAAGARDQLAALLAVNALLAVKERVQGPKHPSTLTTRRQLDYWT
jgi:hypothetical protein